MLIRAFITHKDAENFTDCQDRFSISADTKSIALSDGMSQSIFQKYWAEILVNTYTSNLEWYPDIHSVRKLSPLWMKKVHMYVEKQKEEGKNTWRVERNLTDGLSAGATFLGIRFDGNKWECQVLGDSCLVEIHDYHIIDIKSSEATSSFNNYPDYYDSNPQKEGKGQLETYRGHLGEKDAILLVTDPFSDFLLRNRGTEEEKNFINQLLHIKSHEEYEKVVDDWRKKGMHNDDSTLIVILPDHSDEFRVNSDNISQLMQKEKLQLEYNFDEKKESVINSIVETQGINTRRKPDENNDSKRYPPEEVIEQEVIEQTTTIVLNKLLNNKFYDNLVHLIYSNLNLGWLLISDKQKKGQANKIASEIISLINNIFTKE